MSRVFLKLRGFAVACHLMPTISVTLMVSLLAIRAGWSDAPLALLVIAVLSGQLFVGWSNDAIDANADGAAGRVAKPIVAGSISLRSVWIAALIALVVTIATSFLAAGLLGGFFQVLAVASAWLYNIWLSRTNWSWLPYAVSFGCVVPFITFGLNPPQAPALWAIAVFVGTGVAAHLANALPDLATDRAVGMGGLVTRLGALGATRLALLLLVVSSFILLVVIAQFNMLAAYIVPVVTLAAVILALRPGAKANLFFAVQGLALFEVIIIVATGVPITS